MDIELKNGAYVAQWDQYGKTAQATVTRQELLEAIEKALVSRGKNKGILKAKCPPSDTLEAAAWQGLQSNPFKLSMGVTWFFDDKQRLVLELITRSGKQAIDRDRRALTQMGAW